MIMDDKKTMVAKYIITNTNNDLSILLIGAMISSDNNQTESQIKDNIKFIDLVCELLNTDDYKGWSNPILDNFISFKDILLKDLERIGERKCSPQNFISMNTDSSC